jgi:rhomboid family protein
MPMTKWVRRILIATVLTYFVTSASRPLYIALMLFPSAALYRPWTLVTYMFLHAGLGHIFFNMLGLFFFGPRLENRLGAKGFLWLYFLSGLGGAAASILFARQYPVVGASAAVYGVLVGFAMYWPRERIYIWMVLPVEAWLLVTLFVIGSLYAGINPSAGSRTANFAHLGGIVVAFVFLKWWEWQKGSAKRAFQKQLNPTASPTGMVGDRIALARWQGIRVDSLHELNREEVVRLMTKVDTDGPGSLTPPEREFLDRMSTQ